MWVSRAQVSSEGLKISTCTISHKIYENSWSHPSDWPPQDKTNQLNMSDSTSRPYPLGASRFSNARLNHQHDLLIYEFNNDILDPRIRDAIANKPDLRIADVCCGTGAWTLAVQSQPYIHKSTQFTALDLNIGNLPAKQFTPMIKEHRQYNIHEPTPDNLEGTFDVLNVSLTNTFVDDHQTQTAISNVLSLLKPGGWIQWLELDPTRNSVHCPGPSSESKLKYLPKVLLQFFDLFDRTCPSWLSHVEVEFDKHEGLKDVSVVKPEVDYPMLRPWTECLFMAQEEALEIFQSTRDESEEKSKKMKEHREIVDGGWAEFQETGACLWIPMVRAVGVKR